MSERWKAVYHNGMFIPKSPCNLPEDTEVELIINDPYTLFPEITDPVERRRKVEEIIWNMQANPVPTNASRFTREDLHDRGRY